MRDIFISIKELLLESLWQSKIAKLWSGSSSFASFSGFTFVYLSDNDKLEFLKNYNWGDTLWIGILLILIRVLWVSGRKLNEHKFAQSVVFTPVKLAKQIKDLALTVNSFLRGDKGLPIVLVDICNSLREIVYRITNSHCCVSIKVIEGDSDIFQAMSVRDIEGLKVRNLARDSDHGSRDSEEYKKADHFIRENTAYSTIIGRLRKKKWYYINNDVNPNNGYDTTSPYNDDVPYKSELVLPIMKVSDSNHYYFVGFLCIDCETKDAFHTDDVIVNISLMTADSLYTILTKDKKK